ncbi:MAG TPA: adenylate/guanylate cyclase domain-containing protein [Planctomycetota bacterium]|nr:adenylate/guanylate cyclase domain-containing protein [Planctomycetota bacterium]
MKKSALQTLTLRYKIGEKALSTSVEPVGVTIGRKEGCGVVLPSNDVSRQHALIRVEHDRWILRDLKSSNGTVVDGVTISEHELADGERIRIGGFELVCEIQAVGETSIIDSEDAEAEACLDMRDFNALVDQVLEEAPETNLVSTNLVIPKFLGKRSPAARPVPAKQTARRQDARRVLKILHGATDALMEHDQLDATLERLVALVFEHLPAERCFVLLQDGESGQLVPRIERAAPGSKLTALRISRNIVDAALRSQQSVLVRDTASDQRFALAESVVSLGICSAMCAPLCHKGIVSGLIYVDRSTSGETFSTTELGVLSILAAISAAAVERAQMRAHLERERRARERLARYHAPSVIERIVRSTELDDGVMETEEREVTVVFADLSGFTRIAENMPPREVTAMLNQLFGFMTEEVFREGGTLDKFIGDAVMAFFGAPLAQPDHAACAVRAARGMMARLQAFNALRPADQRLGLRIGINSGPVIVGDVGAQQRRDYTVIGDTVNVASRLESSVARVGQIVIGSATRDAVDSSFQCVPLDPVILKGRSVQFQPYLVLGERGPR